MAITYVNANQNRTQTTSPGSVPKPTGVTDGDFVIVSLNSSAAITSPSVTGGPTWNFVSILSNARIKVFWHIAASDPANYTFSWSGTSAVIAAVMAFRGTSASPIIASSGSETNLGSDIYTASALSFAAQDYAQIALAAHASPNGVVNPSGFTMVINTIHSANSVQAQMGYKLVSNTSGAGSITFDYTQGGNTTIYNAALGVAASEFTWGAIFG